MRPDRDRLVEDLRIDRSEAPKEDFRSRRLFFAGASAALVAGAVWWFMAGAEGLEVETATVTEASGAAGSASILDASGYVVARRQATVSAKTTGRLVEVAIEEGTRVKEGQVLARLDDSNARRALDLAEAQARAASSQLREIEVRLRESELELGRRRTLAEQGIESHSALDKAEAERDSFVARLAVARDQVTVAEREIAARRQDLEDTLIRAPFDGVAISKDAQVGEIVSPMSAGGGFTRTGVGTIVDMSSLEIEVDVNEAFIPRVTPGQPVAARLQAYPEWSIPARVITTVPAADRQKATVKVRIGFQELGDERILPDMGVKVAFQSERDAASKEGPRLLVPENAVRREGDRQFLFVVRGERVERRAVTVGAASGGLVELRSGARRDERVVVDPPPELADGSRVRPHARGER